MHDMYHVLLLLSSTAVSRRCECIPAAFNIKHMSSAFNIKHMSSATVFNAGTVLQTV
jgi:hypothetical protein